jgi:hypothetical protein
MNTRGGSRPSIFKNPIAIVNAAIVSGIASIGASAQSATGGASDQLGARDSRESARVLDFSGNERFTASYSSLKP